MPRLLWIRSSILKKYIDSDEITSNTLKIEEGENDGNSEFGWGWTLAKLISQTDECLTIVVQDDDCPRCHQQTLTIPTSFIEKGETEKANSWTSQTSSEGDSDIEDDVLPTADDLINLVHLNEPAVIHCLKQRYAYYKIYTQASEKNLLAINPYRQIKGLYSDETLEHYWQRGMKGGFDDDCGGSSSLRGPHVFGMVNKAYRQMMSTLDEQRRTNKSSRKLDILSADQSLLVLGESGSGKTFTTKVIIEYLAIASQRMNKDDNGNSVLRDNTDNNSGCQMMNIHNSLEDKIRAFHPILESFGHAQTHHNDNSSRFGALIEIGFSECGMLVGAEVATFFLETNRLIKPRTGERIFHVFYQLLESTDEDVLEMLFLDDKFVNDFKCLSKCGSFDRRDGVEDEDMYNAMMKNFSTMGFERNEVNDILCVTAAIMHAGNITFETIHNTTIVDDSDSLDATLELLQVSKEAFEDVICHRYATRGTYTFKHDLKKNECQTMLESLIKTLYNSIFDYLVSRINELINSDEDEAKQQQAASISVLDMFGFESFEVNSLEQLCTNYCNETLQQQFNHFTFKNEKQLYEDEGIKWANIDLPDNHDVVDLIGMNERGMFSVLDKHCSQPRGSDETFLQEVTTNCRKMSSRFTVNETQQSTKTFSIRYDVGTVEYSIDGFVETNKNKRLPHEVTVLLESSKRALVRTLITTKSYANDVTAASLFQINLKKLEPSTIVGHFAHQLREFRNKIDATSPHYIRCIKPNDNLLKNDFNPVIISKQLRCAGIIEAVTIKRTGFPHIITLKCFKRRYNKWNKPRRRMKGTILTEYQNLVVALNEAACDGGVQMGKTRVFMTAHAFQTMEAIRVAHRNSAAIMIQAHARGLLGRMYWREARCAVVVLQSLIRMQMTISHIYNPLLQQRVSAATTIAAYYRRFTVRRMYLNMIFVARWLQNSEKVQQFDSLQFKFGKEAHMKINLEVFDTGKAHGEATKSKCDPEEFKISLEESQSAISSEKEKCHKLEVEVLIAKRDVNDMRREKIKAHHELEEHKREIERLNTSLKNKEDHHEMEIKQLKQSLEIAQHEVTKQQLEDSESLENLMEELAIFKWQTEKALETEAELRNEIWSYKQEIKELKEAIRQSSRKSSGMFASWCMFGFSSSNETQKKCYTDQTLNSYNNFMCIQSEASDDKPLEIIVFVEEQKDTRSQTGFISSDETQKMCNTDKNPNLYNNFLDIQSETSDDKPVEAMIFKDNSHYKTLEKPLRKAQVQEQKDMRSLTDLDTMKFERDNFKVDSDEIKKNSFENRDTGAAKTFDSGDERLINSTKVKNSSELAEKLIAVEVERDQLRAEVDKLKATLDIKHVDETKLHNEEAEQLVQICSNTNHSIGYEEYDKINTKSDHSSAERDKLKPSYKIIDVENTKPDKITVKENDMKADTEVAPLRYKSKLLSSKDVNELDLIEENKEDIVAIKMKNDKLAKEVEELRSSIEMFASQLNNHEVGSVIDTNDWEKQNVIKYKSSSTLVNEVDAYLDSLAELIGKLELVQYVAESTRRKLENTRKDLKTKPGDVEASFKQHGGDMTNGGYNFALNNMSSDSDEYEEFPPHNYPNVATNSWDRDSSDEDFLPIPKRKSFSKCKMAMCI